MSSGLISLSKLDREENLRINNRNQRRNRGQSGISLPSAEPSTRVSQRKAFTFLVFAIIISWIVVALFTRAIENLFYNKLKFNGESFWQSLFVAIIVGGFFLALIWTIDSYNIIKEQPDPFTNRILEFDGPLTSRDFSVPDPIVIFSE